MDLSVFFHHDFSSLEPLINSLTGSQLGSRANSLGRGFPDWRAADIILIGAPDSQSPTGTAQAIRQYLYGMSLPNDQVSIADLGNLNPKDTEEGCWDVLSYVMDILLKAGKTVVIAADNPAMVYGQYMAYESLSEEVEYVHVDSRFQLEDPGLGPSSESYNRRILIHEPNFLFTYTNLGYQQYFVAQEELSTLQDMNFFTVRYGELEGRIQEAEPYFREAHLAAMDLSATRYADFHGSLNPSPGGFTINEMARMARYAGMATRLSSLCLTGLDPARDPSGMSAQAAAILIWYFIEGFYNRKPDKEKNQFRKYSVQMRAGVEEILFYEDPTTSRWWMEVPFQESLGKANPRTKMVACSVADYETARTDEIPDRWWRVYNRLD